MSHSSTETPKTIFIVPYRNRPEQKFFFCKYMSFLLDHKKDYEIYFSHQCDERSFNRGATRNIGFLAMKEKYPDSYRDMTFVFNDLDTVPFNRIFDYQTDHGTVKHYYGFETSLGGIVVMKGADFERVNGYPNFWSWGREDACLQKRCIAHGLKIDRSDFYKIGSPQILQLFDGVERIINGKDPHRLQDDPGDCGVSTIRKLQYTIDKRSPSEMDNLYDSLGEMFFYINSTQFATETSFADDEYYTYDLRDPIDHITNPPTHRRTSEVNVQTASWKKIPRYPTMEERKRQRSVRIARAQPQEQFQEQGPQRVHVQRPQQAAVSMQPTPPRPPMPPTLSRTPHVSVTRYANAGASAALPSNPSEAKGKVFVPKKTFRQMRNTNVNIFSPPELNTKSAAMLNVRYRIAKI